VQSKALGVLLAAIVVFAISIASAGAASSRAGGTLKLTTKSSVDKYLRSIGVDPRGVVFQHGRKNYAGPRCPGKGWTCTKAKRVVQMAQGDSDNIFVCNPAAPGTDKGKGICVIVQVSTAGANDAQCTIARNDDVSSNISQSCTVTQTNVSGRNSVLVSQTIFERFRATQTGQQHVAITQTNGSGSNIANVTQNLVQASLSIPPIPVLIQEGHQDVGIRQNAGSGNNSSSVGQALSQAAAAGIKGAVTQKQNAMDAGPNTLADIDQTSMTGANDSKLLQKNLLAALAASNVSVTQRQGSASGGLTGHVDQASSGVSTTSATQNENQTAHAKTPPGTLTQVQIGPMSCCTDQLGNAGNRYAITQSGHQESDGGTQTDLAHATCTTSGTCTTNQHKDNNVDSIDVTQTCTGSVESPCTIDSTVQCNTKDCFQVEGSPDSSLTKGVCDESTSEGTCSPTSEKVSGRNGDRYKYGIVYTNAGTADAHDVTVQDTLPAGVSFVSCSNYCSFDPYAGTVTWSLGTVAADHDVTLTFIVDTDADSCSVTNTATVSTREEEATTSNPAVVEFTGCGIG
jgi:uncharacterized repeat protein (TIGR01451 family)